MCSMQEHLGVLLELKGRGCRQMESYLLAQERSWYDFMLDCLTAGGKMKRLDLAINDKAGILDIPKLKEKLQGWRMYLLLSYAERLQRYGKSVVAIYQRIQEKPYISVQPVVSYICVPIRKSYEQYVKKWHRS